MEIGMFLAFVFDTLHLIRVTRFNSSLANTLPSVLILTHFFIAYISFKFTPFDSMVAARYAFFDLDSK